MPAAKTSRRARWGFEDRARSHRLRRGEKKEGEENCKGMKEGTGETFWKKCNISKTEEGRCHNNEESHGQLHNDSESLMKSGK